MYTSSVKLILQCFTHRLNVISADVGHTIFPFVRHDDDVAGRVLMSTSPLRVCMDLISSALEIQNHFFNIIAIPYTDHP